MQIQPHRYAPYTPSSLTSLGIEYPTMVYLPAIIAFHLKECRVRSKKTVVQAARACNISPTDLSAMEEGRKEVPLNMFLTYCFAVYARPQMIMEMVTDSIKKLEGMNIRVLRTNIVPITDVTTPTQLRALLASTFDTVTARYRE